MGYRNRYYEAALETDSPYKKMLSALWRESPGSRLNSGERLMTMAALLHVDPRGQALLPELIRRSGLAPRAWMRRYMDAFMRPLMHCFYAHHLVFMPHGENLILVLDGHVPVRAIMKDIAEESAILDKDAQMPPGLERLAVDVPEGIPRALEQAPRPVVYAGGALALLILKKLLFGRRSGSKGSLGDLEERGMLDENREVDEEKFFKGMMKSVRTVEMPELTEEQILAARERRRASAAGNDNFEKSLSEAEIPANHPWATKEKLTPEEERAAEQRVLEANRPRKRRGVPPPQ